MFWVFEYDVPKGEPYIYRSMADGCAEMVFHYKGRFTGLDKAKGCDHLAILHAQSSTHSRFITHGSFGIFGVYLYPTALPLLFGLSSSSFSNQMPELPAFLGREGSMIQEQVLMAGSHEERVRLLSRFLIRLTRRRKQEVNAAHIAVERIIETEGQINVQQLASEVSLSTRQFERRFKEFSGFTPKLYTRIIRFHRALSAYGDSQRSLTEIAYDCGYYDQSHFIHEFREFSGYHPRQYFFGRPEGIEYRES